MKATRKQRARADSENRARAEKIADRVIEVDEARKYKTLSAGSAPGATSAQRDAAAAVDFRDSVPPSDQVDPVEPTDAPPVDPDPATDTTEDSDLMS